MVDFNDVFPILKIYIFNFLKDTWLFLYLVGMGGALLLIGTGKEPGEEVRRGEGEIEK